MNEKILKIPYAAVKKDWNFLHKYLEFKGNLKYILVGDVDLEYRKDISDLGNLVGVEGNLDLRYSSIQSLGELQFVDGELGLWGCRKIKTLGKLRRVEGDLNLSYSPIESLGDLEFVGGNIYLIGLSTPPSELKKVEVGGRIV